MNTAFLSFGSPVLFLVLGGYALVHASGSVSQRDMMRAGLRLNIAAILVITVLFHFGVAG